MRVFVSGHHGYIGTIMSRLLREAGHTVCGADMYLYDDCTFGDDLLPLEVREDRTVERSQRIPGVSLTAVQVRRVVACSESSERRIEIHPACSIEDPLRQHSHGIGKRSPIGIGHRRIRRTRTRPTGDRERHQEQQHRR